MNSNEEMLEQIDRYLSGEMSSEEANSFENRLNENAELKSAMEFSILANNAVIFHETAALKGKMQRDFRLKKIQNFVVVGLGILLLSMSISGFYFFTSKSAKQELKDHATYVGENKKIEVKNLQKQSTYEVAENQLSILSKEDQKKSKEQIENKEKDIDKKDFNTEIIQKDYITTNLESEEYKKEEISRALINESKRDDSPLKVENTKTADLCDYEISKIKFSATPSCKNENTGSLLILKESIKGGKAPYTFALNKKESTGNFQNLASGEYILTITDANNCVKQNPEKIYVAEINCAQNKQFIFNPEYDKVWNIPYNTAKNATNLIIRDESGLMFYQTLVSENFPNEWNGESNNGAVSKVGVYFYSIEYTDKSREEGTVLISK